MKNKCLLLTALAMSVAGGVSARTMSQNAAIDSIVANNYRLKALRSSHEADYQSAVYEAIRLEDPEVEFEYLYSPDAENKINVGVSQSFDWPGVYKKRAGAADMRREAWTYLYQSEANNLRYNARQAMAMGVYATQRLALLDSLRRNMERLQKHIQEGYDRGQLTILDVKKAALELYGLKTQIADVEQERQTALSELTVLNNGNPVDVDLNNYIAEPFLDYEQYQAYARDNNPSVNAQASLARASRADADAVRASRMPGFSLGYRHAYEDGEHFNGFSVGVSLPVYSRARATRAASLQASSALFEAMAETAAAQSQVAADYAVARKRLDQLKELDAVTLDDSYPRLLLMAYEGGQINVITYIQEIGYFMTARTDRLAAEYQYRLALLALNRYNPEH